MATNYTVHNPSRGRNGGNAQMGELPHVDGQALALDTQSDTILGPCEIRFNPDESVKLDVRTLADAASLDPANSTLVLEADQIEWFQLGEGSWKIKTTAVA